MYKKVLTSAIGLLLSTQVMAQTYQFEGNVNYADYQADFIDSYDAASVSGVYYFSPVQTDNRPLQEAAYLGRNSSLGVAFMHAKSASSYTDEFEDVRWEDEYESTYSAAAIAAETYFINDIVYVGAMVSRDKTKETETEIEYSFNVPGDDPVEVDREVSRYEDTENDWRLNLGAAPVNGFLIWTEIEKDVSLSDSRNLNAKYVKAFDGSAFNIQGGIGINATPAVFAASAFYPNSVKISFSGIDEDVDLTSVYVMGDYYFNNALSLGAGISQINDDDDNDADEYMIRGKIFFTDNISMQAQHSRFEDEYVDIDIYSIGASVRF